MLDYFMADNLKIDSFVKSESCLALEAAPPKTIVNMSSFLNFVHGNYTPLYHVYSLTPWVCSGGVLVQLCHLIYFPRIHGREISATCLTVFNKQMRFLFIL